MQSHRCHYSQRRREEGAWSRICKIRYPTHLNPTYPYETTVNRYRFKSIRKKRFTSPNCYLVICSRGPTLMTTKSDWPVDVMDTEPSWQTFFLSNLRYRLVMLIVPEENTRLTNKLGKKIWVYVMISSVTYNEIGTRLLNKTKNAAIFTLPPNYLN